MRYHEKRIICTAQNCSHWEKDYGELPERGHCGGAGEVSISSDGKCMNFCDITIEDEPPREIHDDTCPECGDLFCHGCVCPMCGNNPCICPLPDGPDENMHDLYRLTNGYCSE
jgi:hypothetical protein